MTTEKKSVVLSVIEAPDYLERVMTLISGKPHHQKELAERFISRFRSLLKTNKKLEQDATKNIPLFFAKMESVAALDLDFVNDLFVRSSISKTNNELQISVSTSASGCLKLIARDPTLNVYRPVAVSVNDDFEFSRVFEGGTNGQGYKIQLEHKPNWESDEKITAETLRCVFVSWEKTNPNGRVFSDVAIVPKSEILAARGMSQTFKKNWGPWVDHFEPMANKTALLRAAKTMGLSEDTRKIIGGEDFAESAPPPTPSDSSGLPTGGGAPTGGGDDLLKAGDTGGEKGGENGEGNGNGGDAPDF